MYISKIIKDENRDKVTFIHVKTYRIKDYMKIRNKKKL